MSVKPDWMLGVHVEEFSKEFELWKDHSGIWHGDAIKYGEFSDISDEEALSVAIRHGFELPRIRVDRERFKSAVSGSEAKSLRKLSKILGYSCLRSMSHCYETGWCSLDFAMKVCAILHARIEDVFGDDQPYFVQDGDTRFHERLTSTKGDSA